MVGTFLKLTTSFTSFIYNIALRNSFSDHFWYTLTVLHTNFLDLFLLNQIQATYISKNYLTTYELSYKRFQKIKKSGKCLVQIRKFEN